MSTPVLRGERIARFAKLSERPTASQGESDGSTGAGDGLVIRTPILEHQVPCPREADAPRWRGKTETASVLEHRGRLHLMRV